MRTSHIIYCVDLDGTMYDNMHRAHLIPEDRNCTASWAPFNNACVDDAPRRGVLLLVRSLMMSGHDVRFLTARGAEAKAATMTRLKTDLERTDSYISLVMRPVGDRRPGWEYKKREVEKWLTANRNCEVVMLEDDPEVVEALRQMDRVTVLQIDSLCADVRSK